MKKLFRISRRVILSLLILLLVLWLLLQMPFFQNWLVHTAASRLSKSLHTTVRVDKVRIGFFNKLNIEGVYVEDLHKDTLLSAGLMQVNITDWFFLKDSADLKYVRLKDVTAKLYRRTDSIWNYQFLVDYFGGGKKSEKKGGGIALHLKAVELENLRLLQLDEWRGKSMIVGLGKLSMEANRIDLANNVFDIERLEVEEPEFREIKRRGNWRKLDSIGFFKYRAAQRLADSLHPKKSEGKPMLVKVKNLKVKEGILEFYNRLRTPSTPGEFDERDIIISALSGRIQNLLYTGDTIRALVNVSARERSGIVVKKLQTRFSMHPQLMEFDDLDLEMNDSRLRSYYAMRYNSMADMEDFLNQVNIVARLKDSRVSMKDIGFFAPMLKTNPQVVTLTGNASGTVSNFFIKGLDAQVGKSRLVGDYSMTGLIDVENTNIKFETPGSQIALEDVAVWAPEVLSLKETPVAKLGVITYQGGFEGTPYNFLTNGVLKTDAGTLDAEFKLAMKGAQKGYKGVIRNAHLNGGKLLDVKDLGWLDFSGTVSSKGFSAKDAIMLEGVVNKGEYAGYIYKDIKADGRYVNNQFISQLDTKDKNLDGNFEVVLDFNQKKERYNGRGVLRNADLRALGFIKDSLQFSGVFDVDFKGKTLDDFLGHARFYDAVITTGAKRLNFDSLLLQSQVDTTGRKTLSLYTNEAEAWVSGKFKIAALDKAFRLFLSRYYPSIIPPPKNIVKDQDFAYSINTRQVEPFLFLIDKNLKGFDNAKLSGSLNTNTNELLINADVPSFRYGSFSLYNASVKGVGDYNHLNLSGAIDNLHINDSLSIPNVAMKVSTSQDTTHLKLNTSTQGPLGDAEIDAFVYSGAEGFEARFNESSIIIDNKKWTLLANGSVEMHKGYLLSNGLTLQQDEQMISMHTEPSEEGNWNDVHVDISKLNMGAVLPYFLQEPRLEGLASGKVLITDPLGKAYVQTQLSVDQFRFNNDSIGKVMLDGNYNVKSKKLFANVESKNEGYDFSALLNMDLNDSAATQINTNIVLRNERVSLLKNYLTSIFDDIDGYANGNLQLVGSLKAPSLLGTVALSKARIKVGYTQCTYDVDTATLNFGDNYIDFGRMVIKDVKKRQGEVEGRMYHRFFDSLSFNMRIRSQGMQVLHTTAADNDFFWGDVVGRASFDLTGPLTNLNMRISGTPTDSSHVYISMKDTRESGEADFLVFKTYGREMQMAAEADQLDMHVDLDMTANPLCKIDVILDPVSGDIIKAAGNGNLKISTGSKENTTMRGRYTITSGSYSYSFQSLIRKPFELAGDGSNYIEWRGDPEDATLNITASYLAKDVSFSGLLSSDGKPNTVLDRDAQYAKSDVNVVTQIKGRLSAPDIDFSIELPSYSSVRGNSSIQDMLRRIREDNTEKLRQVTYLIVFKSFAPYKEGAGSRNPGADLAVNTLTELLSNEMGKILTDIVQRITGDASLKVNLSTNLYSSVSQAGANAITSASAYDRMNVAFNLNRSYLNNRVMINLGSDFDLNVRNTAAAGFQFLPNISVEFILTPNRRLRGILFKRDNLDFSGRKNRVGASISYRKDFNHVFGRSDDDALFFYRSDAQPADKPKPLAPEKKQ